MTLDEILPSNLPAKWRSVATPAVLMECYPPESVRVFESNMNMRVIVTIDIGAGVWLHASCSYTNMLPRWQDLKEVRETFMGDRVAIQVLPPRSSWISIHNYCLHLFSRLDGDTVPEALWRKP